MEKYVFLASTGSEELRFFRVRMERQFLQFTPSERMSKLRILLDNEQKSRRLADGADCSVIEISEILAYFLDSATLEESAEGDVAHDDEYDEWEANLLSTMSEEERRDYIESLGIW